MSIILVKPGTQHKDSVLSYAESFLNTSDSIPGSGRLINSPTYEQWLEDTINDLSDRPELGLVAATQLIAVRQSDQKVIGTIQLRHTLNDYLRSYGGHIGYSVHPDERGKGYATDMLIQCLALAAKQGIATVLVTCNDTNPASEHVIIKAGGMYEDTRQGPDGLMKRFWITTTSN